MTMTTAKVESKTVTVGRGGPWTTTGEHEVSEETRSTLQTRFQLALDAVGYLEESAFNLVLAEHDWVATIETLSADD